MPHKKPKRAEARRIIVENVNVPGYTLEVDAAKYEAMRRVVLEVLPRRAPGLTQSEMRRAVRKQVGAALFPGAKSDWWSKLVQLDLEAKGKVEREASKPLRWHRS